MPTIQTEVLNQRQVKQKIDRIAFQIYENHHRENEIVLAGIAGNGFMFAGLLQAKLRTFGRLKARLVKVTVNKRDPLASEPDLEPDLDDLQDKVVILVDDVINSGKTLIYGAGHFLKVRLKALQTVALIDRDHKRYPIKADYVGLLLSTTLQENVNVTLDGEMAVYLE